MGLHAIFFVFNLENTHADCPKFSSKKNSNNLHKVIEYLAKKVKKNTVVR